MLRFKKFLSLVFSASVIVPLILILLYISFSIFIKGALPPPDEIVKHFANIYARYGYEIIFIGATLEALLIVNFFVPGALAVAMGGIFARTGQVDLTLVVLTASAGAILGYLLDFLLGYFGFGEIIKRLGYGGTLSEAKKKIESSGARALFLGFIHPNIGSLAALAAGTLKLNLLNFIIISSLSTLAWVSFWGLLIFALGEVFLVILTKYFFILVLMALSVWLLMMLYSKSKNQ